MSSTPHNARKHGNSCCSDGPAPTPKQRCQSNLPNEDSDLPPLQTMQGPITPTKSSKGHGKGMQKVSMDIGIDPESRLKDNKEMSKRITSWAYIACLRAMLVEASVEWTSV